MNKIHFSFPVDRFSGAKLREWRKTRMYSRAKLSQLSGISQLSIMQYEHGKATNPTIDTMASLACVLGITVPDLLTTEQLRVSSEG